MGFMFDTVAFNRALDFEDCAAQLAESSGKGLRLFATHVQLDELKNTRDPDRRDKLIEIFELLVAEGGDAEQSGRISTESAVWNVSRWGQAKWGSSDSLYQPILADLNKFKSKDNNKQDALISETAIENNLVLVTDDKNLAEVTRRHGGEAISFGDFLRVC